MKSIALVSTIVVLLVAAVLSAPLTAPPSVHAQAQLTLDITRLTSSFGLGNLPLEIYTADMRIENNEVLLATAFTLHRLSLTATSLDEMNSLNVLDHSSRLLLGRTNDLWSVEEPGRAMRINRSGVQQAAATFGGGVYQFIYAAVVDNDNNLWVASAPYDLNGGQIGNLTFSRISPSGAVAVISQITEWSNVSNLAATPDGSIWFGLRRNEDVQGPSFLLCRLMPDGTLTQATMPNPIMNIASNPTGTQLWVAYPNQQVASVNTSGIIQHTYSVGIGAQADKSYRFAFAPDGSVWATSYYEKSVVRITTTGLVQRYALPGHALYGTLEIDQNGIIWLPATELDNDPQPYRRVMLKMALVEAPPTAILTATPSPRPTDTAAPGQPTSTPMATPVATTGPGPGPLPTAVPRRPHRSGSSGKGSSVSAEEVVPVLRSEPNLAVRRGDMITLHVDVTNYGNDSVRDATVYLPFNASLVQFVDVQTSGPNVVIAQLAPDHANLRLGFIPADHTVVTATLRFTVLPDVPVEQVLFGRATVSWNGGSHDSNLPIVTTGAVSRNDDALPLAGNVTQTSPRRYHIESAVFIPREPIALWYHAPDGQVYPAGMAHASAQGMLDADITLNRPGVYRIVAEGIWSKQPAAVNVATGP